MGVTERDVDALRKIAEHEKTLDEDHMRIGWEWVQVGLYPATIHRLLIAGLVRCSYKSSKHTAYVMTDDGKKVAEEGVPVVERASPAPPVGERELPSTLFSDIIGYDDTKELIREALLTEKVVHILLHGPPSIAKTMFLLDLEEVGGEQALWLLGSGASKAGMWDLIAEKRPRWLLIDELEKMGPADTAGLLSLMEKGRIVRAKVGRRLDEKLDVWVIASANRIGGLSPELLSRFAICKLYEYNAEEFRRVVSNVLVRREGMTEDGAARVAMYLVGKTNDVRDAIRVARLSKRIGVDRAVELLIT